MLREVLQIVNDNPDLNSENIIEKIDKALFKKRCQLYRKWENDGDVEARRQHSSYEKAHESWRESGFSLTHQFPHSATILHLAAVHGCKNIIRAFKERGADIDVVYRPYAVDLTPLQVVIRAGNKDMTEFLLQNGADMNHDVTPLYHAVAAGHKNMIEFFLQKGVDINARLNNNHHLDLGRAKGGNCLHLAVDEACEDFSKVNLEFKEFYEEQGKEFTFDKEEWYADMVEYLKTQGIIIDKTQSIKGYYQIVDYFRDKIEGVKEIEQRQKDYTEIIEFLIDQGIDLEAKNAYGYTPLHCSIDYGGHIEVARTLIRKGANVNAKGPGKISPLHTMLGVSRAMNPYLTETAMLFIESGADVKAEAGGKVTPLHIASKYSEAEIMNALIQKGADVNARTILRRTPLHDAVYGSEEAMLLLLKNDANPWARGWSFRHLSFTPSPVATYASRWEEFEETKRKNPNEDYSDCRSEPGYLMKFKQAYDKQFNVCCATMLLGAVAAITLFATGNITPDAPRIIGAAALVTVAAFAAGRVTYEVFKPSTKVARVEHERFVEAQQSPQ